MYGLLRIAGAIIKIIVWAIIAFFRYEPAEYEDTPMRRFIDRWNRRK